jgi:hypothetical protein
LNKLSEQEIINDWYKSLEDSENSYLNIVTKLVTNKNYFENYVNLSIKSAKKYFDNLDIKKGNNLLFEDMIS